MKKHIRIISVVICIALMITTLPIGTLTASAEQSGYYSYSVSNGSAIGAYAAVAGGNNPQFSNIHVWADKAPEPTNYAKNAEIVYNAGSAVKGSTVIPNEKYTISDAKSYAVKSFYVDGLDIDLTGGRSLTMSADFYVTTNTYTEAHIGVIPFLYNGTPIRMGLLANGEVNGKDITRLRKFIAGDDVGVY